MNLISLYTTAATATGGRADGSVKTADGAINLRLGLPQELGGDGATGETLVNPEQLYACAWAASLADAIGFAAKQHNHILRQISVTTTVTFGQYESDGFGIQAEFTVTLPELRAAEAERIIEEARATCPYVKAFRVAENLKITLLQE